MIRRSHPVTRLVLLTSALSVATAVSAGLKNEPPQGVSLASTQWNIDPSRSDNPNEVIEKAEKSVRQERRRDRGEIDRGVFDDTDDPWNPRDDHDSTFPRRRPGDVGRRSSLPTERGPADIDPTGETHTASVQYGSMGTPNLYVGQLRKNPDKLEFEQEEKSLVVSEDADEAACAPGPKSKFTSVYGDGERRCGWDGRAWVVETTYGKDFTRRDRYELSKDGKTLRYSTTASGKGLSDIRISRTYTAAGT